MVCITGLHELGTRMAELEYAQGFFWARWVWLLDWGNISQMSPPCLTKMRHHSPEMVHICDSPFSSYTGSESWLCWHLNCHDWASELTCLWDAYGSSHLSKLLAQALRRNQADVAASSHFKVLSATIIARDLPFKKNESWDTGEQDSIFSDAPVWVSEPCFHWNQNKNSLTSLEEKQDHRRKWIKKMMFFIYLI